jgi:hypothetical protein
MVPGKTAMAFRKASSQLLIRLFAGDPTLHALIEQNGLSDGVLNQFSRAHLASEGNAAEITVDADELRLAKRIKMATMKQQLGDLERAENEKQLAYVDSICNTCLQDAPESQKRWMEESKRNYQMSMFRSAIQPSVVGGLSGIENGAADAGEPVYTDDMTPVTISIDIIKKKGLADPGSKMAMKIGSIAADMYENLNDGQKPCKEKALIDGRWIDVNRYVKKDLPMLEDAFTENERRTGVAERQRSEKARKLQEAQKVQEQVAAKAADKKAKEAKQPRMNAMFATV